MAPPVVACSSRTAAATSEDVCVDRCSSLPRDDGAFVSDTGDTRRAAFRRHLAGAGGQRGSLLGGSVAGNNERRPQAPEEVTAISVGGDIIEPWGRRAATSARASRHRQACHGRASTGRGRRLQAVCCPPAPFIAEEYDLSLRVVGLLILASALASSIVQPLFGFCPTGAGRAPLRGCRRRHPAGACGVVIRTGGSCCS
jgi:hypothetical protein